MLIYLCMCFCTFNRGRNKPTICGIIKIDEYLLLYFCSYKKNKINQHQWIENDALTVVVLTRVRGDCKQVEYNVSYCVCVDMSIVRRRDETSHRDAAHCEHNIDHCSLLQTIWLINKALRLFRRLMLKRRGHTTIAVPSNDCRTQLTCLYFTCQEKRGIKFQ